MSTILNYRYINARLASSGQPLADEIQSIADAGYRMKSGRRFCRSTAT